MGLGGWGVGDWEEVRRGDCWVWGRCVEYIRLGMGGNNINVRMERGL